MIKRIVTKCIALPFTIFAVISSYGCSKKLTDEEIDALYQPSLPTVTEPLKVYHLGHSLVGKDMPHMLMQLAGDGHQYHSQLGWGATLQSHWEPSIPVNGFDSENKHQQYRDPIVAIESKEYDAFVMTEMVEIKDAIKYFSSAKYLAKFASKIHSSSPKTTIYLYESWHQVTDPEGWINRLDNDIQQYWEEGVLHKALAELNASNDDKIAIYIVPVGQVMSAFFKELARIGGAGNISGPKSIFATNKDGSLDPIHINDMGNYLVALVHYAALYRQSPEGLPYKLTKADGSNAIAPSEEAAKLMQKVTWEVVKNYAKSGVSNK